jgi:hypothetical protein
MSSPRTLGSSSQGTRLPHRTGRDRNALVQHPSVRACAVVAREDDGGNTSLIAYLVPVYKPENGSARNELRTPTMLRTEARIKPSSESRLVSNWNDLSVSLGLNPARVQASLNLLSQDEIAKAERFHFESDRRYSSLGPNKASNLSPPEYEARANS